MGIKVEFNPDLALRNIVEYEAGKRKAEECIPENMKAGEVYDFQKENSEIIGFLAKSLCAKQKAKEIFPVRWPAS